jgi:hypothetical protein
MDDRMKELPNGIAVLTAWLEASPGVGPNELVWDVLQGAIDEGPEAEIAQTMGLAKLAGVLLAHLSKASGKPPRIILQEIAADYGS